MIFDEPLGIFQEKRKKSEPLILAAKHLVQRPWPCSWEHERHSSGKEAKVKLISAKQSCCELHLPDRRYHNYRYEGSRISGGQTGNECQPAQKLCICQNIC